MMMDFTAIERPIPMLKFQFGDMPKELGTSALLEGIGPSRALKAIEKFNSSFVHPFGF